MFLTFKIDLYMGSFHINVNKYQFTIKCCVILHFSHCSHRLKIIILQSLLTILYNALLVRTESRCQRAYILPKWFFFLSSLLTKLYICKVTERISTKLGLHIFTYDCYIKQELIRR